MTVKIKVEKSTTFYLTAVTKINQKQSNVPTAAKLNAVRIYTVSRHPRTTTLHKTKLHSPAEKPNNRQRTNPNSKPNASLHLLSTKEQQRGFHRSYLNRSLLNLQALSSQEKLQGNKYSKETFSTSLDNYQLPIE